MPIDNLSEGGGTQSTAYTKESILTEIKLERFMFPDPDCLKKLSLPARVVRHIRGRKMLYIWSAVVAGLAMGVWYCQLPLVVLPVLLFLAFLASGGRKFPKVFFRTILRDVMYVSWFSSFS